MKKLPSVFRIPQSRIVERDDLKALDVIDWIILSFVFYFISADDEKYRQTIIVDDEEFCRIRYSAILDYLPVLRLKSRGALTARFKRYVDAGLLKRNQAPEHTLYVCSTDLLHHVFTGDPLSPDEDFVFTVVNSPVHGSEQPIHDGEQSVHGGEQGVHGSEQHNKERKEKKEFLKERGADEVRAKEMSEKLSNASANAPAFSLSQTNNQKDSANGKKEDFGENGELPSQGNSFILPSLTESNEYYTRLNNEERRLFDFLVLWICKHLNLESSPSALRYCRRVCFRSVRAGSTYRPIPEMAEAGRLALLDQMLLQGAKHG